MPTLCWRPASRRLGVVPEHAHLTSRAGAVSLEDLDGGGLPGAVGPEQPEDLAPLDREGEPAHGLDGAVRLAQVGHLDRGGHDG